MRIYVYSIQNQCPHAIFSVTETFVAIVILCDDYSSMAGKTRAGKKAKRNRVISRGDGGSPMVTVLKDTVRIGTAYMPRRQRVEHRTTAKLTVAKTHLHYATGIVI